jgi:hypothetical protein
MTAEIAVMNRMGVALAADSAVTIGESGHKVYTSAEKLFQLSEVAPIGVMVYGNAGYAQLPWETVIKAYRKRLGKEVRSTIEEYCQDFTAFLRENPDLFPPENRLLVMKSVVYHLFCDARGKLRDLMRDRRTANHSSPPLSRQQLIEAVWPEAISSLTESARQEPEIEGLENTILEQLKTDVGAFVREIADAAFEHFPRPASADQGLFDFAVEYLKRQNFGSLSSGIVIAGFGEKDYMPALVNFNVEQCVGMLPRRSQANVTRITGTGHRSFVMPYAQQDSVFHFLLGVDTDLSTLMENSVTRMTNGLVDAILDKVAEANSGLADAMRNQVKESVGEKLKELFDEWNDRQGTYFRPVLDTIAVLPKDELAEMAEAFVNLTKFRRRVTPEPETVSGPIDVAVITKGDGFVWIKRKHYFKPEVNPRLMARFYRLGEGP